MEVGIQIELHDEANQPMVARIDQVGETSVHLDFQTIPSQARSCISP